MPSPPTHPRARDATLSVAVDQLNLPLGVARSGPGRAIRPFLELGAYEALWCRGNASFREISKQLQRGSLLPSELIDADEALAAARRAVETLQRRSVQRFGVRVHGDLEYPSKLRDAEYPVELLYYQGWWNLVEMPSVAVVGTRRPTPEGLARTRELVRQLVADGWAIVSGLAEGIDTAAHRAAIEAGGTTIGVLGTPLSVAYPKANRELQEQLARDFLVISQVPVLLYEQQDYRRNRSFFPERNLTMAALTQATILVEAGETSGTLIQARAALAQGRKLFILDRCFDTPGLSWPAKLEKQGALRLRDSEDLQRVLGDSHPH